MGLYISGFNSWDISLLKNSHKVFKDISKHAQFFAIGDFYLYTLENKSSLQVISFDLLKEKKNMKARL